MLSQSDVQPVRCTGIKKERINMMNEQDVNAALFDFLDRSPVPFYAVRNMRKMLDRAGFVCLNESGHWKLQEKGSYYVTRNDSALIAFRLPRRDFTGFQMMASHCDSPLFRIKPDAEITVEKTYVKLNVEKYGGAILAPWLDRPLSIAGRVIAKTEEGIETRFVNIDRDLLIIPNLAIHMNRKVNEGFQYNLQKDMLPLFCEVPQQGEDSEGALMKLIAQEAGVLPDRILDTDLYLYSRTRAGYIGLNREFIMSARLDDLQCAFASLLGFLHSEPVDSAAVFCIFDNEEVGSGSKQGAAGTFLQDTLFRLNDGLGRTREDYLRSLASSFMVSADNAHSVHPNHPDKADPTNRPFMNRGIVIKYSSNQKYTTDAVSGAIFRAICEKADVPWQTFANRSDMIGGSTLGNISQAHVSVNTVDVGLAQLAMHSPCETAGAKDTAYLAEAARILFSGSVVNTGEGTYTLRF